MSIDLKAMGLAITLVHSSIELFRFLTDLFSKTTLS